MFSRFDIMDNNNDSQLKRTDTNMVWNTSDNSVHVCVPEFTCKINLQIMTIKGRVDAELTPWSTTRNFTPWSNNNQPDINTRMSISRLTNSILSQVGLNCQPVARIIPPSPLPNPQNYSNAIQQQNQQMLTTLQGMNEQQAQHQILPRIPFMPDHTHYHHQRFPSPRMMDPMMNTNRHSMTNMPNGLTGHMLQTVCPPPQTWPNRPIRPQRYQYSNLQEYRKAMKIWHHSMQKAAVCSTNSVTTVRQNPTVLLEKLTITEKTVVSPTKTTEISTSKQDCETLTSVLTTDSPPTAISETVTQPTELVTVDIDNNLQSKDNEKTSAETHTENGSDSASPSSSDKVNDSVSANTSTNNALPETANNALDLSTSRDKSIPEAAPQLTPTTSHTNTQLITPLEVVVNNIRAHGESNISEVTPDKSSPAIDFSLTTLHKEAVANRTNLVIHAPFNQEASNNRQYPSPGQILIKHKVKAKHLKLKLKKLRKARRKLTAARVDPVLVRPLPIIKDRLRPKKMKSNSKMAKQNKPKRVKAMKCFTCDKYNYVTDPSNEWRIETIETITPELWERIKVEPDNPNSDCPFHGQDRIEISVRRASESPVLPDTTC